MIIENPLFTNLLLMMLVTIQLDRGKLSKWAFILIMMQVYYYVHMYPWGFQPCS